jgi:hypothetical protein
MVRAIACARFTFGALACAIFNAPQTAYRERSLATACGAFHSARPAMPVVIWQRHFARKIKMAVSIKFDPGNLTSEIQMRTKNSICWVARMLGIKAASGTHWHHLVVELITWTTV